MAIPLPLSHLLELLQRRGEDVDVVTAELVEAGRRAALRTFGGEPELEVTFEARWPGTLEIFDVYRVVDRVQSPAREIALATAHQAGLVAELGDELLHRVHHRSDDWDPSVSKPMPFPLPAFSSELGEAIVAELSAVFTQHGWRCVAPWPEGTVGHALASGGGWLRGFVHDDLTIERTFLHLYRADLDHPHVDPYVYWGFHVRRGDQRGVWYADRSWVDPALHAPFATGPSDALRAALAQIGAGLRDDPRPRPTSPASSRTWIRLLARPAAPTSLLGWCQQELPALLVGSSHTTTEDGQVVTCRAVGVEGDLVEDSWVVRLATPDGERWLPIGGLSVRAYDTPAPTGARLRAVLDVVERFLGFWREEVRPGGQLLEARDVRRDRNLFELMPVVEAYATDGPPGAPPVPISALVRSGPPLRSADPAERALVRTLRPRLKLFAVVAVDDYLIGLADDDEMAFCSPSVSIVDVRDRGAVDLLTTDPQAEATGVIDGDAWAYAAFAHWLSAALVDAMLDRTIEFTSDEESTSMSISEWLAMRWRGLRDNPGFIDWRVQSTQVVREPVSQFVDLGDEIGRYRRFLREVISPAFG